MVHGVDNEETQLLEKQTAAFSPQARKQTCTRLEKAIQHREAEGGVDTRVTSCYVAYLLVCVAGSMWNKQAFEGIHNARRVRRTSSIAVPACLPAYYAALFAACYEC